jgi:multicomponent Na+:H+ antiporter subunit G
MLLASLGLIRLPDLFTRMQAATKAGTLGVATMFVAVAMHFGQTGVTAACLLVVIFLCVTAPVAAHVIGRAAYYRGVPLWEGSVVDELAGRYDPKTRRLEGAPAEPDSPSSPEGR